MKLLSSLVAIAFAAVFAPGIHAQSSQKSRNSYSIHTPSRKYSFVLASRDGNISAWGEIDSSTFNSLRDKAKEDTLFVRKDGDLYAITDRNTVSQAKSAVEPMEKLGRQQGDLGRQQGQLGREQGKLGREQGELGRQLGELGRELGQHVSDGGSTKEIDAKMQSIAGKMKDLGKGQSALGEKQKALGAKQGELGKQQSAAANEADAKITKLIDEAFSHGLAHKS